MDTRPRGFPCWTPTHYAAVLVLGAFLLLSGACRVVQELEAMPDTATAAPFALSQEEEERMAVVWEAWHVLEETYGDRDELDRERAVGGAILGMLATVEQAPYPFLTELHTVAGEPPEGVPVDLEDLWRAWVLLRQRETGLDTEELAPAAVREMTRGLEDPFASFMTPEEFADSTESSSGEFQGIGAWVEMVDGRLTISRPIPGSPAEALGILPNDVVTMVDGQSLEGLTVEEAVQRIKGLKGTQVVLEIQRPGVGEPLHVVVTRGLVDVPSVEMVELPINVGYIRISGFDQDTGRELERVLQDVRDLGLEGLVLDLRGNSGGFIDAAVEVAGQFLDGGLVLYEMDAEGRRKDLEAEHGGLAVETPLAVVVDGLSASAAEIVAGALQDRSRAQLFGETTYGKGAVQVSRRLSDGSALWVTTSYWYTPSGELFHGRGITPDLEVALARRLGPDGRIEVVDTQLRAAYEHVLSLLDKSPENLPTGESVSP